MPEPHPRAELGQPRLRRRPGRPGADREPPGRPPHQHRIAGRIGRRQLQPAAGSARASASSCRPKLSSIRPSSGTALLSPNPPASCAGVSPRGSSSNASGFPFASAMIWSRTCASSGPVSTDSSSSRASSSARPSTTSSGSPATSLPGTRAANTRPTGSAASRRAANPSACAEAWSSHCWSSTTHTSGRSSAVSDSKPEHGQAHQEPVRHGTGAEAQGGPQRLTLRHRERPGMIQHGAHS